MTSRCPRLWALLRPDPPAPHAASLRASASGIGRSARSAARAGRSAPAQGGEGEGGHGHPSPGEQGVLIAGGRGIGAEHAEEHDADERDAECGPELLDGVEDARRRAGVIAVDRGEREVHERDGKQDHAHAAEAEWQCEVPDLPLAKALGHKAVWARGLGRRAPVTVGRSPCAPRAAAGLLA